MLEPIHLGDGAYITDEGHAFRITANHHLAEAATDVVYIQREDAERLIKYLEDALSEASDE